MLRKHKQNESNVKEQSSLAQHSQSIMVNDIKRTESQQIYPEEQIREESNPPPIQPTLIDMPNQ